MWKLSAHSRYSLADIKCLLSQLHSNVFGSKLGKERQNSVISTKLRLCGSFVENHKWRIDCFDLKKESIEQKSPGNVDKEF